MSLHKQPPKSGNEGKTAQAVSQCVSVYINPCQRSSTLQEWRLGYIERLDQAVIAERALTSLFRKGTFPVRKRCFLYWVCVFEVRGLPCRKRCERDGKYLEARAASVRLAELKTQEAQRMRQAIMERQVLHSN